MIPLIAALGALGAGGLLSRRSDMTGKEPGMIGGVLQDLYRSSGFATAGNYRRSQQFQAEQQQQQQQEQQAQQKRQLLAQAGFPTEAPWAQNITPEEVQSQLVQYQRALGGNQATAQYNLEAPQRALEAYGQQLDLQGKELANAKAMMALQQAQQQAAMGPQPERVGENMLIQGPNGPELVPIPGGKVERERAATEASLNRLQSNVAELSNLVGQSGTEFFGETAGQMEAIHGAILGDLKNMFELGVLQQGDIEFLNKLVPDPTSYGNLLTGRGRLQAQYGRLMQEVQDRLLINQGYERID